MEPSIVSGARKLAKQTVLHDAIIMIRQQRAMRAWRNAGKLGPPPPVFKQRTVREYARRFSAYTLVESGTFLGEMVYAMRNGFRAIYSIELDPDLWKKASERFARYKHIRIIQGDSAEVLPEILSRIDSRCVFWLDGHYSEGITAKSNKETPIEDEIEHILKHRVRDHVTLIDDARCFNGENDYPKLADLQRKLLTARPDFSFEVQDDIIRFHRHLSGTGGGRET